MPLIKHWFAIKKAEINKPPSSYVPTAPAESVEYFISEAGIGPGLGAAALLVLGEVEPHPEPHARRRLGGQAPPNERGPQMVYKQIPPPPKKWDCNSNTHPEISVSSVREIA